jgi:sterol desaturase/sphingolipid hydroxylase (fatty acid hydroxylase superfamily)
MRATEWILRVSESKSNYWATYVVDGSLMFFFLGWDVIYAGVGAGAATALFLGGIAAWTLTEYCFHRWMYHDGLALTRNGHEKHHHDPKSYIAMPWFITPLLFLPPHQLIANYYGYRGVSAFFAGWFFGFIAYSFMHHSLHHYRLKFAWYRHLQSEHRLHHAFPEKNFGVTMRFWDRVFGTVFTKSGR